MTKPEYIPYHRPSGDPEPMRRRVARRGETGRPLVQTRARDDGAAGRAAAEGAPVTMTPADDGADVSTDDGAGACKSDSGALALARAPSSTARTTTDFRPQF